MPATADDVVQVLGRPLTEAERGQVEWWLAGIERVIAKRYALDSLDADDLRYVMVEAVTAKVRRSGRDESSITVAVDDGSVTRRYESSVSASDISEDLWALLAPVPASSFASVAVVSPLDVIA